MLRILCGMVVAVSLNGCVAGAEADSGNQRPAVQSLLAAPITMPIGIDTIGRIPHSVPPPSWGFFGTSDEQWMPGMGANYHDLYFPLLGVPVGATVSKIEARVSTGSNDCRFWVWQDLQAPNTLDQNALVMSSSTNPSDPGPQTISSPSMTSFVIENLVHYSITLGPVQLFNGGNDTWCAVSAASVTFTPPQ